MEENRIMEDLKNNSTTRLEKARKFKEEGKEFINAGKYVRAIDKYRKISDILEGEEMTGQNKTEKENLLFAAQSNIALCWMKIKEWERAKTVCSKILEVNSDVAKVLYRRGECSFNLGELEEALIDFNYVLRLEPNNKAAINQIAICRSRKMKLFQKPWNPSNEPVPSFHMEYIKKYGASELTVALEMAFEYVYQCPYQTLDYLMDEIRFMYSKRPELIKQRWGSYDKIAKQKKWKIGEIIDVKLDEPVVYNPNIFHTMKNHKIIPWKILAGKNYVSIGCVDFAQLLFGIIDGDFKKESHFHGVDSSLVSIVRCKVLYKMILNQASARSILQVWFSTGWSEHTLKEFTLACQQLLKSEELNTGLLGSMMIVANFLVRQVKCNRFLHPNEHPRRIFLYFLRLYDQDPSNIWHIFTN